MILFYDTVIIIYRGDTSKTKNNEPYIPYYIIYIIIITMFDDIDTQNLNKLSN